MSTYTIARGLLKLFPGDFRSRFENEWLEVVEWRAGGRKGYGCLAMIVADTLGALAKLHFSRLQNTVAMSRDSGSSTPKRGPGGGGWLNDIRFSLRAFRRNPIFSVAAILSLGLGIGANTGIFTVVNAVLLRPIPYEDPARLAIVWNAFESGWSRLPVSGPEFVGIAEEESTFESVGGIWVTSRTIQNEGRRDHVSTALVTSNFLDVIGVSPALGRNFTSEEMGVGTTAPVLISHALWVQQFGSDPDITSRTLIVENEAVPIVGVLAEDFKLLFPADAGIPETVDILKPFPWPLSALPPAGQFIRVVGRMLPGITLAAADDAVKTVAANMRDTYPAIAQLGDDFSAHGLQDDAAIAIRPTLLALTGAVALFLLLASANVANLLLARVTDRKRELATRICIGATRGDIARQLVLESLLLSAIGTVVGLALGWICVEYLWQIRPDGLSRIDTLALDGSVVAYVGLGALLSTVLFGLAPLSQVSTGNPVSELRTSGHSVATRTLGLRRLVTASEVAIAVTLVVGAVLLNRSAINLVNADTGFDHHGAVAFTVPISDSDFPTDADRATAARALEQSLTEMPGIAFAGATSHLPYATWANWGDVAAPGEMPEAERAQSIYDLRSVTNSYFETIGATLVTGRWFDARDHEESAPVVIVDRTFATKVLGGTDIVDRQLKVVRYTGGDFVLTDATVAGVVEDILDRDPSTPSSGQVFWPYAQSPRWELTFFARRSSPEATNAQALAESLEASVPGVSVSRTLYLNDLFSRATARPRFVALLSGIFSMLAALLAAGGIFSVVTFSTSRRVPEIGLRMSLGASRGNVFNHVMKEALVVGLFGAAAGALLSIGSARLISSLLFGVVPGDPVTLIGVSLSFILVCVVASALPAYRATLIDPVRAIQESK